MLGGFFGLFGVLGGFWEVRVSVSCFWVFRFSCLFGVIVWEVGFACCFLRWWFFSVFLFPFSFWGLGVYPVAFTNVFLVGSGFAVLFSFFSWGG